MGSDANPSAASRLIDISPTISERAAVWPGDVTFSRKTSLEIAKGARIDLSAIRTTVHVGAHADAPSHYVAEGASIADRPLDLYYGPCQVLAVDVERGARILPADLPDDVRAPRILLRTGTWPDPEEFSTDFAALSPEVVDHLHAAGVVLVGIDTPSVDLFEDKRLVAHSALARHDMAILECLNLSAVETGLYTLIALPLRIEGADASPVRAALVPSTVAPSRAPACGRASPAAP